MSEEILIALMKLFAIIAKQDGGVEKNEEIYVQHFLHHQLGERNHEKYYQLFLENAGTQSNLREGEQLTSVLDSVRILSLCKKINQTLNQQQKIVVLIRVFELVASDRKFTKQRLAILETISDTFRIRENDVRSIRNFVSGNDAQKVKDACIVSLAQIRVAGMQDEQPQFIPHGDDLLFLRIPGINLYFFKYTGKEIITHKGLNVTRNSIYHFSTGSIIKIPGTKTLYYSDVHIYFTSGHNEQNILLTVRDVSLKFPNGYRALHNISFSSRHGQLTGILGASGAGKTTLLNVLTGLQKPDSGTVTINDIDVHKDPKKFAGIAGYVPQDDLLIEELSVYDNLYYSARLCFKDLDEKEIRQRVEEILQLLGLTLQKESRVGNSFNNEISGGQRKRLNIALELIREPALLFLDEPTSGLSSADSENIMDLLHELTLKGILVVAVIHQPSSEVYKLFDTILLLDRGGHLAYAGNPVEAIMYFKGHDGQVDPDTGECPTCGNINPEQIFNIIEAQVVDEYGNYTGNRKVSPEQWEQHFHEEVGIKKTEAVHDQPVKKLNVPGWFTQFRLFLERDLKSKLANRQYILLTVLEAPLLAFILSYIIRYIADPASDTYFFRENENLPIYIFMLLIVAVFLGLTLSAEEIFKDRKILKREHFLNLSRSGYLFSKISLLFAISAMQAFLFVLIANQIIELKNMGFYYWFAFFTTAACANMLGLNISATFNSAITIYIIIPMLIIPMMILSGAMFSFDKINRNISSIDKVPLLAELMPTRWSYEALMVNQFKNNFFQVNFYDLDKDIVNTDFKHAWYLPELEERLNILEEEYLRSGNISNKMDAFLLLSREIQKEDEMLDAIEAKDNAIYDPEQFDLKIAGKYRALLDDLSTHYIDVFNKANHTKNTKVRNLLANLQDTYYQYLNAYHNESLSDHVRKIYERRKIVEYDHRLVRLSDPIYMDPEPKHYLSFRTHFFAPRKYFAGRFFDTYWFNMVVIWILSAILYVLLYFDLLKKVVGLRG